MRSLRDLLINKREERGLTISQVAYETNISKKYIEALENESFNVFPAEAYLLGFLKNYAEFLGLELDAVLAEYKNCLLREEPTPLNELMGVKKTFVLKPWMVYAPIILLILSFGLPIIVKNLSSNIEKRKEALRVAGEMQSKVFDIGSEFVDTKVRVGDIFTLTMNDDKLLYTIMEINSDIIVTQKLDNQEKVIHLTLGKEVISEFTNKNEKYTVTLLLKDIGGFSDNSAIMKAKVETKDIANFTDVETTYSNSETSLKDSKILIVKKHTPEPYSLNIKFEGDLLFRYQLRGEELIESMYQKNSVFNLDVTRSIQIWTSNAGLTKLKINGETLVLGRTGEVHVFTLRWLYIDDKDEYRLEYATTY